jgi:Tol biopolymer transport system component
MTFRRQLHMVGLTAAAIAALVIASPLGAGAAPLGGTIRVSVATDGTQGNMMSGRFSRPAISGNARFTAFDSIATTLVPNDTNRSADVFVHDGSTGVTERISVSTSGVEADNDSESPSVDKNGRVIAFDSHAENLVAHDTNSFMDVFVHDRMTGRTGRVSVNTNGGNGNGTSFGPSISADGRFVAFASDASNLVPDDTNHVRDMFVRDLVLGTTERVSVASDGTPQNNDAAPGSISADGNVVAFSSFASNLVPDDTNDSFDVFVRDRVAGTTVRASVSTAGVQGDRPSTGPAISGTGRIVAFASDSTNLVPGDTNNRGDAFVHDLDTGSTIRVSVTDDEGQANGQSVGPGIRGGLVWGPAINYTGTRVAFDSVATNLVAGDTNTCQPSFPSPGQCPDVFVRDLAAGTTIRVSVAGNGAQTNDASTDPAMDAAGTAVAFFSAASNLVPGDTNICIQFPVVGHCTDIFEHFI